MAGKAKASSINGGPAQDVHDKEDAMDDESRVPNRLILCFDGTGNSFQGSPSDTNIVKLLDMFNRSAPHQMHYYQPGIGTYTGNGAVNLSLVGRIKRSITQTVDSGLATSFEHHVIAGYRFLMRYYGKGDRIYIFGFSRGAFTARFLARMISHVGLLSMGNEEMVPFAYKVYQDYEMGKDKKGRYMATFRSAFCRHEGKKSPDPIYEHKITNGVEEVDECNGEIDCESDVDEADATPKFVNTGIKVHFLGLFDTVNSVGTFDVPGTKPMPVPEVVGTAEHVRHAVAIDERRVKFKVALLAQDKQDAEAVKEDHKEVWFPGNHGDIGGGWTPETEPELRMTWWDRVKRAIWKSEAKIATDGQVKKNEEHAQLSGSSSKPHTNKARDPFQLSDIALKWMVDELDNLPADTDHVLWHNEKKTSFMSRFARHRTQAVRGFLHDTMVYGRGTAGDWGISKIMMWRLMEYLPIVRRWEYNSKDSKWDYIRFPLNMGDTRDLPPGALLHHSVLERKQLFPETYRPENQTSIGVEDMHLTDALSRAIRNGTKARKDDIFLGYAASEGNINERDRVFEIMPPTK